MTLNAVQIGRLTGYKQSLNLLDQVIELKENETLVAKKSVSMNESFFKGHFPGNPVMPGVLIIQTMVEAAEVLFNKTGKIQLAKIKKARFRQMVKPGDQLTIKITKKNKDGIICDAKAFLEDEVACSAKLEFVLV